MMKNKLNQKNKMKLNQNKNNKKPMKRLNGKIIQLIEKIIFWMNNYETKK